ncbi:MAG: tyrosine recombinase XerD [Candidatus Marinimicrobia bacterium]|nr:tyrosine recombinase XerD [Candidatus Neomarinimicrobiota bacterium]|tara:strand:- start:2698 stop:3603 length:906 start_codon:yes stop_codon:yes gene_type:complete
MNMHKLKNYIFDFLNSLYFEKKYSQNTIKAYKFDLKEMYTFLNKYNNQTDLHQIDRSSIQLFLSYISEKKISARTLSRKIATIKSFFKYLVDQEVLEKNITKGISFPKLSKKLPLFLTEQEINKLMELPKIHSKHPVRDKLILELLYSSGIRISELITIKIKNIRLEEGLIKVVGKGNVERNIFVGAFAKKSLKKYLKNRKSVKSSFLFPAENKTSKTGHISVRKVYTDVKKFLILATGNDSLSPHSIRHTTATHLLENGADLMSVKEILGHSSLKSTQVYTHVQKEYMRKIYKQAHPEGN